MVQSALERKVRSPILRGLQAIIIIRKNLFIGLLKMVIQVIDFLLTSYIFIYFKFSLSFMITHIILKPQNSEIMSNENII